MNRILITQPYIGLIARFPWIILSLCLIGLLIYVLGRLVGGVGLVAADSTGVETDRYEVVVKPSRRKKCFEAVRRLIHIKYHITAIIDHPISY